MSQLEHATPAVYREYMELEMDVSRPVATAQLDRRQRRAMRLRLADLERTLRLRYGYHERDQRNFSEFFLPSFLSNSWAANTDWIYQDAFKGGKRVLKPEEEKALLAKMGDVRDKLAKKTQGILDPEFVRLQEPMVNTYNLFKEHFFTSHQAFEWLQRRGLEALYRFIPQANFAFETNPLAVPEPPEKKGLLQRIAAAMETVWRRAEHGA